VSLPPPPFVHTAAPVTRPYPAQQILWPSCRGHGDGGGSDSSAFPRLTAIKARQAARPPEALTAFVEAVRMAQDRIRVLDDFLFKPQGDQSLQSRYDQILRWLPNGLVANEIRFLTNAHENQAQQDAIRRLFNERVAAINQHTTHRTGVARIEIRFSLGSKFPYVHDRFAIIDDELRHFGATVGGLHGLVNAATRGWNAEAHGAVRFFNDAWDGDGDAQACLGLGTTCRG
jgi:hypothetical protein